MVGFSKSQALLLGQYFTYLSTQDFSVLEFIWSHGFFSVTVLDYLLCYLSMILWQRLHEKGLGFGGLHRPLSTMCWLQDLTDWLFLTGRVFSALLIICSWCAVAKPNPVLSPSMETKICKTFVSVKCPDRNSSISACGWSGTGKNHSQIGTHVRDCVSLGWIHLSPLLSGCKYCRSFTEFGGANI